MKWNFATKDNQIQIILWKCGSYVQSSHWKLSNYICYIWNSPVVTRVCDPKLMLSVTSPKQNLCFNKIFVYRNCIIEFTIFYQTYFRSVSYQTIENFLSVEINLNKQINKWINKKVQGLGRKYGVP